MTQITRLLREGTTLYLVTAAPVDTSPLTDFVEAKLLNVYLPEGTFVHPAPMLLVDGPGTGNETLLELLDLHCPEFNYSQYAIVHAAPDTHQCIMAGAGTGKTATMVRRVLFLLHMNPQLSPREIVMITFTREATHEMRQRLRGDLVERYRLTGRPRCLQLLEEVGEMPIKTIHAYTRELVKRLGSVAGYSQNLQIREFRLERKQILEDLLAKHLPPGPKPTIKEFLHLHVYEFIDAANRFWEAMENKGLSRAEIGGLNWGSATGGSAAFQSLLAKILPEAEARLQELKIRHDAASLKDLTRQMDGLRTQVTNLASHLSPVPRYLFVDEFQDTDDTQIRLVAWLQRELKLTLFVVGDIKQSIYRFRGAKYTAFRELKKELTPPAKLDFRELTKNYRTGQVLLDSMHPCFARWHKADRLAYHPVHDRLRAVIPGGEQLRTVNVTKDTLFPTVLKLIGEATAAGSLPAGEQVALLVRTNRQARQIEELCEENGIKCVVDAGGDFWNSEPVRDLLYLVTALLYPADPTARLNLHESPYSHVPVPWDQILQLGGDPAALLKLLNANPPHPNWNDWLAALRAEPVLAVLRRIIGDTEPALRVFRRENDQEDAVRYSRNLGKLLLTLQETFPSRSVSLHTICQYLSLKRATDRDTDQEAVSAEEIDAPLLCQTVHKAKGKQYHTVIVPFTGHPFRTDRDELLLAPPDPRVGWRVYDEYGNAMTNDHYSAMLGDEETETAREETRLLYVAMTRAKRRLWVLRMETNRPSWSTLL